MAKLPKLSEHQGVVIEVDGASIGVVNPQGKIKTLSTVCPHAACDVEWNDSEKTWDCPCHGSRFKADGSLLQGPAVRGLDPVKAEIEGDQITLKK
ncbi:MAG: Rieske 2Fe-2S domain-containing protein [Parcubacteria group bacterium]|nr:Rieske 2Fe-2S domain-containing protein [Parcubacteria group bacterium]